jgi:hypothetical protein
MAVFNVQLQPGDFQTDMVSYDAEDTGHLNPGNSVYSPGQAFRLSFQAQDGDVVLQRIDDSVLPVQ